MFKIGETVIFSGCRYGESPCRDCRNCDFTTDDDDDYEGVIIIIRKADNEYSVEIDGYKLILNREFMRKTRSPIKDSRILRMAS